jgi:hypothetical protein
MVFEAASDMHAQFYRTSELYRLKRKQQAGKLLPAPRSESRCARGGMGISPHLLYDRIPLAPA